jgi:hypothetical protein
MPLADLINVNFDIVSPEPFGMWIMQLCVYKSLIFF